MVVTVNGQEYRFTWGHDVFPEPIPRYDGGLAKAITTCRIFRGTTLLARGEAFCGTSDEFSVERGRKIAMARALKAVFPEKAVRAGVWQQYHDVQTKTGQYYRVGGSETWPLE